jgi:WD40 repeat protein
MWTRVAFGLLSITLGTLAACGRRHEPSAARPVPATPVTPRPAPAASLGPEAATRCDAAARAKVVSGAYATPVLALVKRDYDSAGWSVHDLPHVGAATAPDVRALVCITESRAATGKYVSGSSAFRRIWNVTVVGWPDGGILDRGRFEGGPPPTAKQWSRDAGYGVQPDAETIAWLVRKDPQRSFLAHDRGVTSLAFSPDGGTLAAGQRYQRDFDSAETVVTLWDVGSRKPRRWLKDTGRSLGDTMFVADSVDGLAFSHDGKTLVTSGGRIVLWDVTSGTRTTSFGDDSYTEPCVAFAPDSRVFAACSHDSARLWDVPSRRELPAVNAVSKAWSLAFSPDGRRLAIGATGPIGLWDLTAGRSTAALGGHTKVVRSVTFSPDGSLLASASDDGTVKVWRPLPGPAVRTLEGHRGAVNSVAFSPDGKTLATAGADGTVRLWTVATGAALKTLSGHRGEVRAVAFHPNGRLLASGGFDRIARLWSLETDGADQGGPRVQR